MQRRSVPSGRTTRRGFSLIAITVTLMIVAAIAVATLPYTATADHQLAATRTSQILRTLELNLTNSDVTNSGNKGFCVQVGVCPKRLIHLTTAITGTDLACTGSVYTSGTNKQTDKWATDNSGNMAPYTGLPVSAARGVWTPLGMIHDSVLKISASIIELHMDSLSPDDAKYLDLIIDGTADSAAGNLRYDSTAVNTSRQKFRLVRYRISNANVAC